MAVSVIASATSTPISTGNISVTLPGTPQAGDWYTVAGVS